MCRRMENSRGDLTDILRNSGLTSPTEIQNDDWHLLPEPTTAFVSPDDNFGDPFSDIRDPFLVQLPSTTYFNPEETADVTNSTGGVDGGQKMLLREQGNSSLFSRMLQISSVSSKVPSLVIGPPPLGVMPVDQGRGLQNPSPRMQGMKRRKSQVKKVVCIPAPPAANGRPSGEAVPSDLWAWRKYGQKPIKGSPYPRGYYRCSSSKGCSARKQVERSRTDPNMLVITYTAEHNHPWPTQRNVLAGSTRSQPSKGNNASISKMSPRNKNQSTGIREEHNQWSSSSMQAVKEEEVQEIEKALADPPGHEFDQVFDESFMMPDSNQTDSFFTDMTELETDPMHLIFPKGFMRDHKLDGEGGRNKPMDPFSMFDWGAGSSLEEDRRNI